VALGGTPTRFWTAHTTKFVATLQWPAAHFGPLTYFQQRYITHKTFRPMHPYHPLYERDGPPYVFHFYSFSISGTLNDTFFYIATPTDNIIFPNHCVPLLRRSLYLTGWADHTLSSGFAVIYGLTHIDNCGHVTLIEKNHKLDIWETRCQYTTAPSIRPNGLPYLGYWHLLTCSTRDHPEVPTVPQILDMLDDLYLSTSKPCNSSFFLRLSTYIQLTFGFAILLDTSTLANINSQADQTWKAWNELITRYAGDSGKKWQTPIGYLHARADEDEVPEWLRRFWQGPVHEDEVFEKAAVPLKEKEYPGYFPGGDSRYLRCV